MGRCKKGIIIFMYTVLIRKKALKEIQVIPSPFKENIIKAINELARNPRPFGCKKLKGDEELYRIRINDYRVIYSIEDKIKVVEITSAGHRKGIYKF